MFWDTTPGLLSSIQALERGQEHILVALEGRCASGKTTLAGELGARYGWGVVHMDDFFLRAEQRTEERYATPGENVDHERFLEEVLLPLRSGQAARYRPFDCKTQRLSEEEKIMTPVGVTIIEGSYSCHPSLWEHYDLRVFLSVGREEQLRRIERRNGAEQLAIFRNKWIPLEERYFAAFRIEQRCDYRLKKC